MKVILIPSTVSAHGEEQNQYSSSMLINDTVALDAGCLGFHGEPSEQTCVRHILLTHSHIDHIASLPIFVENAYEGKQDCVTECVSEFVLDCLRRDIFNDRVWPDFLQLSATNPPFLKLAVLHPNQIVELEGLRITPVPVHHTVPTMGFIMEDRARGFRSGDRYGPDRRDLGMREPRPEFESRFPGGDLSQLDERVGGNVGTPDAGPVRCRSPETQETGSAYRHPY